MKKQFLSFAGAAMLAALIAVPASAHRQWMLPSSTVLSGEDVWVTVDAAVSNDLFYFEHQPMRLDAMKAWAPDGTEAAIENKSTGRYRSTFDVHLTQKGTWRIASVADMLMGSYDLNGKTERLPDIPGQLPSLANPPPACRFAPRCPLAREVCFRKTPRLRPVEAGHEVACWDGIWDLAEKESSDA